MMKGMMVAALCAAAMTMAARSQVPPPSATDIEAVDRIHTMIDANHDGRIARQEMQVFGVEHKMGTLLDVRTWKRTDLDHDGRLSRSELSHHLMESYQRRKATGR